MITIALVLAVLTNRHCIPDDYCDPDPIRGGCSESCTFTGSPWSVVGKTIGFYILLGAGYTIGISERDEEDKKRYMERIRRDNIIKNE